MWSSFVRFVLCTLESPEVFLFFINVYWCIVALQYCIRCRYIQLSYTVNQLYVYIDPSFQTSFHLGNHRALSRVPCSIQQVLISFLFYTQQCVCVNPLSQFIPPLPFPASVPWYPYILSLCLQLHFCCLANFGSHAHCSYSQDATMSKHTGLLPESFKGMQCIT